MSDPSTTGTWRCPLCGDDEPHGVFHHRQVVARAIAPAMFPLLFEDDPLALKMLNTEDFSPDTLLGQAVDRVLRIFCWRPR